MTQIVDTKNGKFVVLPNDSLGKVLISNQDYEPHFEQVARAILSEGMVCLDCGANLGYHTVGMASKVGKTGKVVSFEPQKNIYYQLCGNVFINKLRNVTCYNVALGDQRCNIYMDPVDIDAEDANIGSLMVGIGGDVVQMITLDQLHTDRLDFIKIDVQGCEEKLLAGAGSILSKFKPCLFIELENEWLMRFGSSSEIVANKLLGMGYVLVRIKNEYPCDHVAVHRENIHLLDRIVSAIQYPTDIIDGAGVEFKYDRPDRHPMLYGSFKNF